MERRISEPTKRANCVVWNFSDLFWFVFSVKHHESEINKIRISINKLKLNGYLVQEMKEADFQCLN